MRLTKQVTIAALVAVLPMGFAAAQSEPELPKGASKIISDFQSRYGVDGGLRPNKHQGIDIGGPRGTVILAAADGKVLETDVGTCWGPTVVIDHGKDRTGQRLIAAYGHLGRMDVKAGQQVKRGQKIAILGNNQNRYNCIGGVRHLHFQLGRVWRGSKKGTFWGHVKYLRDGKTGTNPHDLWADGPGKVTCFVPGQQYPAGTLTYPVLCKN